MKYLRQFGVILAVTFSAELLEALLPMPVPASIYGLILMLLLLMSGLVKLEWVKETGDFLIEIMPLMFIPAAAGLIDSYHELDGILFPVAVVVLVTTIVVMVVTGRTAQWMIRKRKAGICENMAGNSMVTPESGMGEGGTEKAGSGKPETVEDEREGWKE